MSEKEKNQSEELQDQQVTKFKGFFPKTELIDYRKWSPFQHNLKILYHDNFEKLVKSYEKNGAFAPAFIWKVEEEGKIKYNILDAHQRHRMMMKKNAMFSYDGGKTYSYEHPCYLIEAETVKDAAEKVLIITSQLGTMTQEGLDEYAELYSIKEDWISDMTNYDGIFTKSPSMTEEELEGFFEKKEPEQKEPKNKIVLEYSEHDYEIINQEFNRIDGSKESIVWNLMFPEKVNA